ncbi:MAG: response regulator [Myxococcales bacterium]|nr:response regulator [Myxococcales bacterium]
MTPPQLQIRADLAYLDDSVIALRQVRRALSGAGIFIECYTEASELLERDRQPALSAVLLDVDLGGNIDGPSVAAHLRDAQPTIEIAFFTAVDATTRSEELRSVGLVFDKSGGLDDAVRWLRERTKQTPESR